MTVTLNFDHKDIVSLRKQVLKGNPILAADLSRIFDVAESSQPVETVDIPLFLSRMRYKHIPIIERPHPNGQACATDAELHLLFGLAISGNKQLRANT